MARILIIDDEKMLRDMLREILQQAGHEIDEAPDGKAGIERYSEAPTELVITDLLMPHKDGIETIRELRRDFLDAKIIAITGFRGRFNRLPAAQVLGVQRTLMKPFTQEELLQAVEAVLAG